MLCQERPLCTRLRHHAPFGQLAPRVSFLSRSKPIARNTCGALVNWILAYSTTSTRLPQRSRKSRNGPGTSLPPAASTRARRLERSSRTKPEMPAPVLVWVGGLHHVDELVAVFLAHVCGRHPEPRLAAGHPAAGELRRGRQDQEPGDTFYFGLIAGLPPGVPGGGTTGMLSPEGGGVCFICGSTPIGGVMTPPERLSSGLLDPLAGGTAGALGCLALSSSAATATVTKPKNAIARSHILPIAVSKRCPHPRQTLLASEGLPARRRHRGSSLAVAGDQVQVVSVLRVAGTLDRVTHIKRERANKRPGPLFSNYRSHCR